MTNPAPDYIQNTPSTDAIHTAPPKAGGEFTTPFTPAALAQIGVQFIAGFLQKVVEAIVGVFVPGVSAFEQLANWAVVQLPALILAPLNALVTILVTVLDSVPVIGPPIGDAITDLANMFGLMKTTTATAQTTANTSAVGVAVIAAQLAGGGTNFSDTFDEAASGAPVGPYDRIMGSGSGTWGPNGSGSLVWTAAGSASQACFDRVTTSIVDSSSAVSLASGISVVLTNPPQAGSVSNSRVALLLRCNAANDTYVQATIDSGLVQISYTVAGAFTAMGATVSVAMNAGDTWEFRAGEHGVDDWQFNLLQNGLTVCSRTDSGHASQLGTGYDNGALTVVAGVNVAFFVTSQIPAPSVEVLNIFDRTP